MTNIGTKFLLAQRFIFDPNSNSLADQQSGNEVVRLGSNESRILLMLSERPNEVLTRHELHEFVWRDQGFEVDDSSLTQAISTLRKMLKDSTKSPEFVKTVPKRGYQLICSVERMSTPTSEPNAELEDIDAEESTFESVTEEIQAQPQVEDSVSTDPSSVSDNATTLSAAKVSSKNNWFTRAILFVAVLLPIIVFTLTKPAESQFRQIAEFSGVPVMTPANHPQLMQWMPSIEQCVARYVENHTNDVMPVKVIATGGQGNKLVLNYIHDTDHSYENVTLRIFAGQNDPTDICK
tara:strand:+ start:23 stop:901 length:879 start_codon:yes stop_codon:yes gene_type:complete